MFHHELLNVSCNWLRLLFLSALYSHHGSVRINSVISLEDHGSHVDMALIVVEIDWSFDCAVQVLRLVQRHQLRIGLMICERCLVVSPVLYLVQDG